jgi:acetyl-CoA synthetase
VVDGDADAAAVAVSPPGGGPSRLVVFAVPDGGDRDGETWRREMQDAIRTDLNPLFKIHDVVAVTTLPRTASAKVMRRELRSSYEAGDAGAGV